MDAIVAIGFTVILALGGALVLALAICALIGLAVVWAVMARPEEADAPEGAMPL